MKCFRFHNGEKKAGPKSSTSFSSLYPTESTDRDKRRSGSELSSQNASNMSAESFRRNSLPSLSERPNTLKVFTFSELKIATKNFSPSLLVGEGGFGRVYRGMIKDPMDAHNKVEVAVKQLNRNGLQGHKEWINEVNYLGIVDHPNLVKLVGYCAEDDERGIQRLLIYEFMPNRSVENQLSDPSQTPLSWAMRLKVALEAARGLAYLHEEMDFQIIFRDFKPSNILLDKNWNARLSDFGLAHQGPEEGRSHVSTSVVGTVGYAAPEYVVSGHLTVKSDVWSYGVVLYELITGRRPVDLSRSKGEQKMLEWIKPYLTEKRFPLILDPRIREQISLKSAQRLGAVANKCLARHPKSRPKMSEILEIVEATVESASTGSPHPPIKITDSRELSKQESKKRRSLKRAITDFKTGGSKNSVWYLLTPRLIKTCYIV